MKRISKARFSGTASSLAAAVLLCLGQCHTLSSALYGQEVRRAGFTDQRDGTIRDNGNGLIWLKDPASLPQQHNADAAISLVAGLKSGDHGLNDGSKAGDWRIPTSAEIADSMNQGAPLTADKLSRGYNCFRKDSGYLIWWSNRAGFDSGFLLDGVWPVRGSRCLISLDEQGYSEEVPLRARIASKNNHWELYNFHGWFALHQALPEADGVHYPFGPQPETTKGKELFLKLGDEGDSEPGFYIFYRDDNGVRQIAWHSPESYPRGRELRFQDSGRIEFIGMDGHVKGFYHAVNGGWRNGWQTGP